MLQRLYMKCGCHSGVCHRRYSTSFWHGFNQNILPLAVELWRKKADASDIATRVGERGDEPLVDHIFAHSSDRHCIRQLLQRAQLQFGTSNDDVGFGIDEGPR
jgi:hypothetical protein